MADLQLETSRPESDRWIALGNGLVPLPERLLLAHAQGRVLFIAGAGISRPSGYPDFRRLVIDTYLDRGIRLDINELIRGGIRSGNHRLDATIGGSASKGLLTVRMEEPPRFLRFQFQDFDQTIGLTIVPNHDEKTLRLKSTKPRFSHREATCNAQATAAALCQTFCVLGKETGQPQLRGRHASSPFPNAA